MCCSSTACTYRAFSSHLPLLTLRKFKGISKQYLSIVPWLWQVLCWLSGRQGKDVCFRQRVSSVHQQECTRFALWNLSVPTTAPTLVGANILQYRCSLWSRHTLLCVALQAHVFCIVCKSCYKVVRTAFIVFILFLEYAPCYMYIALGVTYSFVPQACGGLESDFTLFPNTLLRARSTLVLLTKAKCKPHVYIYVVQVNALG